MTTMRQKLKKKCIKIGSVRVYVLLLKINIFATNTLPANKIFPMSFDATVRNRGRLLKFTDTYK